MRLSIDAPRLVRSDRGANAAMCVLAIGGARIPHCCHVLSRAQRALTIPAFTAKQYIDQVFFNALPVILPGTGMIVRFGLAEFFSSFQMQSLGTATQGAGMPNLLTASQSQVLALSYVIRGHQGQLDGGANIRPRILCDSTQP